ncbi:MAG TPA: chromosome segregation protein SMC [Gemmataceae bacterium]|jgi:chromosome segregation protein|nr:chromosome segregation protein SMC [Gemmataceae bacterium]
MLKCLELIGFKSFADKTQFEFSRGITAVVGPNGSGKSNIVDAVRWVLGEQSAKSLRGGEMADVIFNGSTTRRSLGLAEVTMTFDNSGRALATDGDEVQITRRVYRDGQGEYLINQQPSRLKDIKDLFLGSGAGADAYCVIEQGRVDVLLQASTKDRRTIFEEAAGISRFKAKKIETLRKLERVEQNLQRLQDIVDEVDKQLRSVKLQASKAQRYQEYSNRLKELRVALGLQEYAQLAEHLQSETAVLEHLRGGLEEQAGLAERWEADTRRLEESLARLEEASHAEETRLGHAREQIATQETTIGHEASLSEQLASDLTRTRASVTELNSHVAALAETAAKAAAEVRGVDSQCQEQRRGLALLEQEHHQAVLRLAELHKQIQTDRAAHLEKMRQAAHLQNDVVSYKGQIDNLSRERERLRLKNEQAAEHLASLDLELQELTAADEKLQARLAAARQKVVEHRQERERLRQLCEQTAQALADLRATRSGLASRIEVLEGLERSLEGLGTGVREVIGLLQQPDPGPWRTIIGMTADFLTVRRDYAPLVDLALGDRAQRFLVRDAELLQQALQQRTEPFSGRVSFQPCQGGALPDDSPQESDGTGSAEATRLQPSTDHKPSHPGIVAAVDQLVTCEAPELRELPAQLLGRTLVVRDLQTAREVSGQTAGYRFITLQGELLEPDGTLTVGTHHAQTGILSRKSELRDLRERVLALDAGIATTEKELAELRERSETLDRQSGGLQEEVEVLAEQAADLRSRITQHREKRDGLHEEVSLSRSENSRLEQEMQDLEQALQQARAQAEAAEQLVHSLQARMDQAEREIREREQQRQQYQQQCTAAKVAVAQVEERLSSLRVRHRQVETDLEQRRLECRQSEQQLDAAQVRLVESQGTMLRASSILAHLYLDKENAERNLIGLQEDRDRQRQERQVVAEHAHAARSAWQEKQEQAHACELKVNDLRHRRDSLIERMHEDYQLDLREVFATRLKEQMATDGAQPTELVAEQANEEIEELRRKLGRLGSVNLDSLQELAELESRASGLKAQYDDLTTAKKSLEEIISKINQDSRRLFMETFATIRTHFQELFRKLFGGGMADIVLEDESDVLESGIEIIARPPGKELRSISLMSGGEKTMTAVALLLAIFRSKPSPFCILDEVDAALDEANIGRFTAVLREFLDRSHFIIITHSKRTMAVADVLYGITMQESGISKRVAVRFEDWPEDGQPQTLETAAAERNGD